MILPYSGTSPWDVVSGCEDSLVKSMMFAAMLVFAVGPRAVPVSADAIPAPAEVSRAVLVDGPATRGIDAVLQQASVVEPGTQDRVVRVKGRPLSLSLMRADRTGLAVLSVPKRSVIPSLPEIDTDEFLMLVAAESGCRPVGRVQVVGSRRGPVALATGLTCG